jgi:hypothetical protein
MQELTFENLQNCDFAYIAIFDKNNLLEVVLKDDTEILTFGSDDRFTIQEFIIYVNSHNIGQLFFTNAYDIKNPINTSAQETDKGQPNYYLLTCNDKNRPRKETYVLPFKGTKDQLIERIQYVNKDGNFSYKIIDCTPMG